MVLAAAKAEVVVVIQVCVCLQPVTHTHTGDTRNRLPHRHHHHVGVGVEMFFFCHSFGVLITPAFSHFQYGIKESPLILQTFSCTRFFFMGARICIVGYLQSC